MGQDRQRHRLQGGQLKRIDVPAVDHIGVRVRDLERAMDDHIKQVEELFSAAKTEFKHMEYFYFHNCLY